MCTIDGKEVPDKVVEEMARARAKNIIVQEIQEVEVSRNIEFQRAVNGDLNEQVGGVNTGQHKGRQSKHRVREVADSGDKSLQGDDGKGS